MNPAEVDRAPPLEYEGGVHTHDDEDKVFVAENIGQRAEFGSLSYKVSHSDSHRMDHFSNTAPKKGLRNWIYPRRAIKFDRSKGEDLWTIFKFVTRNGMKEAVENDLVQTEEPWRSNLHSFISNLWAYELSVPEDCRDISVKEIAERSLREGHTFAKWLDQFRSFLMNKKFRRKLFSNEENVLFEKFHTKEPRFKCVGHLFRPNSLFEWEPPNIDPRIYTQIPVVQDQKALELFGQSINRILEGPKMHFFVPINDPYAGNRDTTKRAKEGPQWQLDATLPKNERGVSKTAFIPRELKESRCASVEDAASLATIRLIEMNVRKVLALDSRSKMETSPLTLSRELIDSIRKRKRFGYKTQHAEISERWGYCRDFKKEGLTKPQNIVKIMMDALKRRWPGAIAFGFTEFFQDWKYEFDGEVIKALRGHGLGMCNALTTLMQLGIEESIKSLLPNALNHPVFSGYVNDDAALVFENEEHATLYSTLDQKFCIDLGLEFKKKSTFLSEKHVVLCELYASEDPFINNKESFSFQELANITKAVNASHARDLTLSMNLRNVPFKFVDWCMSYWGPVLFKNEHRRPRACGGWFRDVEMGVDCSYLNKDSTSVLTQMEESAEFVYKNFKREFFPWRKFKSTYTKRSKIYPKEWLEERGEKLRIESEDTFRPQENPGENTRSWISFENKIRIEFSKACRWYEKNKHRRRTILDLYKKDQELRPKEDIMPPVGMCDESSNFEASFTQDIEFVSPYSAHNVDLDLFLYKSGQHKTSYPRKMGIGGMKQLGSVRTDPSGKQGGAQRAISLRHLYGTGMVPLKVWNLFLMPDQEVFNHWHDPISVARVYDEAWKRYSAPIPLWIPENKKKLLEERDSYYGRKLTWKEWITIGSINQSDLIILERLKGYWNKIDDPPEVLEDLSSILRTYPGLGRFFQDLVIENEDRIFDFLDVWIEANEKILQDKKELQKKKKLEREQGFQLEKLKHSRQENLEKELIRDHYFTKENGLITHSQEIILEDEISSFEQKMIELERLIDGEGPPTGILDEELDFAEEMNPWEEVDPPGFEN